MGKGKRKVLSLQNDWDPLVALHSVRCRVQSEIKLKGLVRILYNACIWFKAF